MTTFQFADDPLHKRRGRRPSNKPGNPPTYTVPTSTSTSASATHEPANNTLPVQRPSGGSHHPVAKPRRSSTFAGIINTSNGELLSLDQILEEARLAEEHEGGGEVEGMPQGEEFRPSRASSESISGEEEVVDDTRIIAADGTAYSTSSSENPNDQDLMNHIRRKRTRTVTTPFQSRVLRKVLAQTSFPSTEMRLNLATALGMNPRTVQIWFQNQRQKAKNRQAAQQEKWAASNIFFHNLTVMPSAQQPRRTSVTVTLDKILPPTTEDPTRAYLDGEHRKRRKSSAANLSAANITLSVNPKPSPTPTHVSPTNSAHIGSSRSLKHQQPQQFIMTTAADDMVQHHAATSVVPLQHPLYAQPMPMSPVFSTGFVQHTSTTAAVAQHNLLSAFPYASPAHTGAYAGFSNLALAPHEQQQSHHHHHQQHHHQSTMTAAAAAAAAAAASNPFGYMNMIPTLDLLASAALEDEGFVIDQQQDGGCGRSCARARGSQGHGHEHLVRMDGKHGNAYGVEHGDEEEDDDVANRMVSVHGGVEVNGHEVVVHDASTWRPWYKGGEHE
ncbi:hypothetical protein BC938DRAFT_480915 [Jimgerdemannia flammicorona]|uniref:Homeobox domain-containing protein n=1 Tax=Jimgerdemannia flammicorona TaxID=994334 RepID=A0A433QHA0_9FUNG|nr:hypothetical protein BC938DRAFT_480915 [Jimgerdemannia flammicorona]